MEKVSIAEVEPDEVGGGVDRRGLSEPLGATAVAINHYRIAPGRGFPGGLHAHADQEEIFLVIDGEATFETLDGEVAVGAGEAIRFAPGEFQSGKNEGHGDLLVVALGAPRDSEDVRIPVSCPDCDAAELRLDFGGEDLTFGCSCGAEHHPRPCPECGGGDLRVELGTEAETLVVCGDCGAEFDDPPLRDAD